MPNTPTTSFDALVEIQGDRILRLIKNDKDHAEYLLHGFKSCKITICDYRRKSLAALEQVINGGDKAQFAPQFNHPAQVVITPKGRNWQIELRETKSAHPEHIFWIAIGLSAEIPIYDYIFHQIAPLDAEKFALVSLYRSVDQTEHPPVEKVTRSQKRSPLLPSPDLQLSVRVYSSVVTL